MREEIKEKNELEKKEKKKSSTLQEIASWCVTLLLAIVLALVLKNFVIINATVPTGSMEHTIEPGDDLFGLRLTYKFSEPQRGDIIIFKYPDDETQKFVKRVIGLPGETVTITDGKIYIDDSTTPLEENYLKEEWVRSTGPYVFEVPEDGYLVLGDNRNDSLDARYWENTYVTKDEIIGKAYMIYYPFNRFGSLYAEKSEE
jgi:signal peptidase I